MLNVPMNLFSIASKVFFYDIASNICIIWGAAACSMGLGWICSALLCISDSASACPVLGWLLAVCSMHYAVQVQVQHGGACLLCSSCMELCWICWATLHTTLHCWQRSAAGVWRSCGGGIHRSTTTRAACRQAAYCDAHNITYWYSLWCTQHHIVVHTVTHTMSHCDTHNIT